MKRIGLIVALCISVSGVWAQEKPVSPQPKASEMSKEDRDAYLCKKYGCDGPVSTFKEAATEGSTKWFVVGYMASGFYDLAATQKCINERTCSEGNVVLGNSTAQRWGVGTALIVVGSWAGIKLREKGHGELAGVILTAASAVHVSLGTYAVRRR